MLEVALDVVEEADDADMRYIAALTGLMIASSGRVPRRLATDIVTFNGAPAHKRSSTLVAVFENSEWVFDGVCGRQFDNVIAEALAAAGCTADTFNRHVWRECRLDRYWLLASEAEFVESMHRTGPEPMLAYFIFGYLEAHGGTHLFAAKLLREVARGSRTEAE
jgi:hypothetical protein